MTDASTTDTATTADTPPRTPKQPRRFNHSVGIVFTDDPLVADPRGDGSFDAVTVSITADGRVETVEGDYLWRGRWPKSDETNLAGIENFITCYVDTSAGFTEDVQRHCRELIDDHLDTFRECRVDVMTGNRKLTDWAAGGCLGPSFVAVDELAIAEAEDAGLVEDPFDTTPVDDVEGDEPDETDGDDEPEPDDDLGDT